MENQKSKEPLDIKTLKECGEFFIAFDDGKGMKCRFVEADNYNLLVTLLSAANVMAIHDAIKEVANNDDKQPDYET